MMSMLFTVPITATSPTTTVSDESETGFIFRFIRACWRLALLGLVFLFSLIKYSFFLGWRRSHSWKSQWLGNTCKRALRAIDLKVQVREGKCKGGEILVSNHLSYLDILVLSQVVQPVFISKSEVRSWPLFGIFAHLASTVFIERGRRATAQKQVEDVTRAVSCGVILSLFPEGGTTNGSHVLKFRSSLLEPAVQKRWRVIPAALHYRCRGGNASACVCWWGETSLVRHLFGLLLLDWIEAEVVFGDPMIATGNRKDFAAQLRDQVTLLKSDLEKGHHSHE